MNIKERITKKTHIPKIRPGAKEFIERLSKAYELKIFTTRSKELALEWVINNNLSKFVLGVTNIKERCFVFIDDTCINFDGNYLNLFNDIQNFKPWYK